jgi:pilus assembly protein CpaE
VEKILGTSVDLTIPSSRSVPISVNKGNPVLLEEPRGNVAEAIRRLAAQFAPQVAGELAPPRSRRTLFQRS